MTSLLEQAFRQAAQLSEETQNEIAAQLLADMESATGTGSAIVQDVEA